MIREGRICEPNRNGKRPTCGGGRRKIIRKAKGLDLVWVARVSRPPAGVCCYHLALSSSGDSGQPTDIDAVESEFSITLPPQLRALLINYSLGHLKGGPFVLYGEEGARALPVDGFVCLTDPDYNDDIVSDELIDRTEWLREDYCLSPKFLYLASSFDDTEFVISCRRSDHGSVHKTDKYQMEVEPGSGLERIAGSIGEFLAMLQPRTWPLTDI